MTQHSPKSQPVHSPSAQPHHHSNERPRGILKNPSYTQTSPTNEGAPLVPLAQIPSNDRPGVSRELSEREIVLQNTIQNAGHRRSSSNPRGPPSRRQSGTPGSNADENSPRLKWDEANLYLTEQQRDSTMKITEPKTPYAGHYDPGEDEEEIAALDANQIVVDELDKTQANKKKSSKEDDIPGLDLGEPEVENAGAHHSDSEKRVIVDPDSVDETKREEEPPQEQEKHRQFEELRKKHYEMKNVKNLLGHADELLAEEEDDDAEKPPVPPMPNGR
ncbi:Protein phosphatase inhibitor 2 (IPP-2) [Botryosphaeria dothidea]|uniref:Protein phosphatase inhibitor 2 (IPP-2) n=1 Tax=Botryosphaeria dothidea TaxID=55169 RepID=A0A8H4J631_9PEZI|nr:Protein phosphatase inhibitor 2 (IPP-2) [Botryosphaeria dothidea]